jgi:SHS2 domain-containing protein
MEARYSFFDHTADLGICVFAPTVEGLIRPATDALYAAIGELAACGPPETLKLEVCEEDGPALLRAYLAELLRLFETCNWMVTQPVVGEYTATHLRVSAQALHIDTGASIYYREVKAITYHELAIREVPGGYEATVIVDI